MGAASVPAGAREAARVPLTGRSLVAGANAWFRASESRRPDRILDDPWAERLAERDPRVQAIRFGRFVLPPLARMIDELQVAHCVRHRAVDARVLGAVSEGARQVVVVGAGYDMRPARFAARLEGVRWIELDHPATQERKRRLLARLAGLPEVERAPVDLAHEDLDRALGRTCFRPELPACVVVEGVVHYLARERVESLLRSVASLRAKIVFTFISSAMYARATTLFVRLVQAMREVPRLHFAPAELAALCARAGLPRFRSWTFEEQVRDFAPQASARPARLSQDVAEASPLSA